MLNPFVAIDLLIEAGVRKVEINNEQPHRQPIDLADTIEAQAAELISFYQRRVKELLEANTRYLERARDAERSLPSPQISAGLFRSLLASMRNIDRHEIVAAGYDMPDGSWQHFRENPWERLLQCNDDCRAAIMSIVMRRHLPSAVDNGEIVTP